MNVEEKKGEKKVRVSLVTNQDVLIASRSVRQRQTTTLNSAASRII